MARFPARDEPVRRHRGLPPGVLSPSLLPGDGVADVGAALRSVRDEAVVALQIVDLLRRVMATATAPGMLGR